MNPIADQIDLIKTASSHVVVLQRLAHPWTDEHELRVASASLRFLLVDDTLQRAWKAAGIGGPIIVDTMCFAERPSDNAVGYCGGADLLPGMPFSIGLNTPALVPKKVDLKTFLHSTCISVRGTRVSRHDVIRYVANTKGGAHYDPKGLSPKSRQPQFEVLRRLERDGFGGGFDIRVGGRNLVHHEIASVMQSVVRSDQVQRLITLAN